MNKKLLGYIILIINICFGVFIQTFSEDFFSKSEEQTSLKGPLKRVEGTQHSLWAPVSSFEDGSTYMIRSVSNPNLYWDLTGGYLTNGTEVQLYTLNYSHAQKFYFKKQFEFQGCETYRLAPLFAYDKVLRVNGSSENAKVVIASETYTDTHLISDKFWFFPTYNGSTQFFISTAISGLNMFLTASTIQSGEKIIQKTGPSSLTNDYKWEIVKTDYIGLNVGNKVFINGTQETRYVARVPYVGEYVIETFQFGNSPSLDTYLRLNRDSDDTQVAYDDNSGNNYNAKIVYNFTTIEEYSIFVRGNSNYVTGYCYLVLRPLKTIYMTGVYDYRYQKIDRVSALNNAKNYCRNLGYFPIVYGNKEYYSFFYETDWENRYLMDRDYYVFYGHGDCEGTVAEYYNGQNEDPANSCDLPDLSHAGFMAWMICNGANDICSDETGYAGMAYESVLAGADSSLGFRGTIYNITCDSFIPKLFESLETNSLVNSILNAAQYAVESNQIWWIFYGYSHCDILNSILYKQGDTRGHEYHIQLNRTLSENDFVYDNGFIRKKDIEYPNIDFIKEKTSALVYQLSNEWDETLLFLGGPTNNPEPIAMCADKTNGSCVYTNLFTGERIEPNYFEFLMGGHENETIM